MKENPKRGLTKSALGVLRQRRGSGELAYCIYSNRSTHRIRMPSRSRIKVTSSRNQSVDRSLAFVARFSARKVRADRHRSRQGRQPQARGWLPPLASWICRCRVRPKEQAPASKRLERLRPFGSDNAVHWVPQKAAIGEVDDAVSRDPEPRPCVG